MEPINIQEATANALNALEQAQKSRFEKARSWLSDRRVAWNLWLIRTEMRRQNALPDRIADARFRAQLEYSQKLAEIDSWGKIEKEKCKLELIRLHNKIGIMQR
jgi:type II secretory pathway pseudopilin PulG